MYSNNFHVLRHIFSFIVMLFHISLLSQAPGLYWLQNISSPKIAVQCFFVISGYLVTMSYDRSTSILVYAKRRFCRIAPAYIFIILGSAVLLSVMSQLSAAEYFTSSGFLKYIFYNLILSNYAAPSLPGVFTHNGFTDAVNGSLWTIKIETSFYIILPLIVLLIRRFGYRPVLFVVIAGGVLWNGAFSYVWQHTNSYFYLRLSRQLPGDMVFFGGGMWAYYETKAGKRLPGIFPIAAVMLHLLGLWFAPPWLFNAVIAPFVAICIVYWVAVCAPVLPGIKGHIDFSYGLYLFHFPIVQTVVALGLFRYSVALGAIVIIIVACALAVASWCFLESKFLSLKHRSAPIAVPR